MICFIATTTDAAILSVVEKRSVKNMKKTLLTAIAMTRKTDGKYLSLPGAPGELSLLKGRCKAA